MKKLQNGLILLDRLDLMLLGFSVGGFAAYFYVKYKKRKKNKDQRLITELKAKSPLIMLSDNGKSLKLPVIRGGEIIKNVSILIKSKRFAAILRAIIMAQKTQYKLRLLQYFFFVFNQLLTASVGVRFAIGGSLEYSHIILLVFPSVVSGFLIGMRTVSPLMTALLPLAILYGRGIEDIPDPSEKCKVMCKVAEEFHNKQLKIEMKNFDSFIEEGSAAIQSQLDKVNVICVEEKLSLVQRYKLKQVLKSEKARKRVQHFSEFIKKFPECDVIPAEVISEQIVRKIPK
jgi:hypothetical protein